MTMKIAGLIFATAFLAIAPTADAKEPFELNPEQMDMVSAGAVAIDWVILGILGGPIDSASTEASIRDDQASMTSGPCCIMRPLRNDVALKGRQWLNLESGKQPIITIELKKRSSAPDDDERLLADSRRLVASDGKLLLLQE